MASYPPRSTPGPTGNVSRYTEEVINDFWETAPPAYKYAVFGGMGLTFIGIVIIIIGAVTATASMTYIALPFIGVGLLTHMASLGLRGHNIRKELKAAEKRAAERDAKK